MAQSTTNLGKIHVFPSETLYNQFKNLVADNDLALLKDDGAYIIAANLAQNGYVKFSNGLILQWGAASANSDADVKFAITFTQIFALTITAEVFSNSYYGIAVKSVSGFRYQRPGGDTATINYVAVGK